MSNIYWIYLFSNRVVAEEENNVTGYPIFYKFLRKNFYYQNISLTLR